MFKFVWTPSQRIGDLPVTDTLFLHIAWKYTPSQPIRDHPLWPCPLQLVNNFVRHIYCIYIYGPVLRLSTPSHGLGPQVAPLFF